MGDSSRLGSNPRSSMMRLQRITQGHQDCMFSVFHVPERSGGVYTIYRAIIGKIGLYPLFFAGLALFKPCTSLHGIVQTGARYRHYK